MWAGVSAGSLFCHILLWFLLLIDVFKVHNFILFYRMIFNRNPAASSKMSNILDITKLSIESMKLTESFQFFFGAQVD